MSQLRSKAAFPVAVMHVTKLQHIDCEVNHHFQLYILIYWGISDNNDDDNMYNNNNNTCEISGSHGGEYDVQSCILGCTAM
jgi:hypothetical protein